jgi:hypothetical protein
MCDDSDDSIIAISLVTTPSTNTLTFVGASAPSTSNGQCVTLIHDAASTERVALHDQIVFSYNAPAHTPRPPPLFTRPNHLCLLAAAATSTACHQNTNATTSDNHNHYNLSTT